MRWAIRTPRSGSGSKVAHLFSKRNKAEIVRYGSRTATQPGGDHRRRQTLSPPCAHRYGRLRRQWPCRPTRHPVQKKSPTPSVPTRPSVWDQPGGDHRRRQTLSPPCAHRYGRLRRQWPCRPTRHPVQKKSPTPSVPTRPSVWDQPGGDHRRRQTLSPPCAHRYGRLRRQWPCYLPISPLSPGGA